MQKAYCNFKPNEVFDFESIVLIICCYLKFIKYKYICYFGTKKTFLMLF